MISFVVMLMIVVVIIVVRRTLARFLSRPLMFLVAFILAAGLELVILLDGLEADLFGGANLDNPETRGVDGNQRLGAFHPRLGAFLFLESFVGLSCLRVNCVVRDFLRLFERRRQFPIRSRKSSLPGLRIRDLELSGDCAAARCLKSLNLFGVRLEWLHLGSLRLRASGRLLLSLEGRQLRSSSDYHAVVADRPLLGAIGMPTPRTSAAPLLLRTVLFFFGLTMRPAFLLKESNTVGDRDLVIVGMDFGKSQKTVPIAAVVNESGLERGLHAGDFGEVNIAPQRFLVCSFEIEFLDFVTA